MLTQVPGSYRELLVQREQAFHAALNAGRIDPFVYPWDTLPAAILILAVLFLPRLGSKYSRWLSYSAFLLITFSCSSIMRRSRSLGLASGYGIGLMCMWGIVWSAVLLVFNDPKTAFQRVEWRDREEKAVVGSTMNGSSSSVQSPAPRLRNRKAYGTIGEESSYEPTKQDGDGQASNPPPSHILIWQPYPDKFRHRLDWVIDLCTSFRGPGWNWHIQTLPAADYPSPTMLPTPPSSTKTLTRLAIRDFLLWYLTVDILKTALMTDPYFWGIAPISSPASPTTTTYLPALLTTTTSLLKLSRLLLSLAAVASNLSLIFTLCPLTFALLFPLLNLDLQTRLPLLEPSLYPPFWGAFTPSVLDNGLAGWWGKWWHQLFRMGISEPSRVLLQQQTLGWDPRSPKGKLLQLVMAFGISGTIHAAASWTTFNPDTRQLSGPFVFFVAQAAGIAAEGLVFQTLGLSGRVRGWPRALRRAGTLGYVMAWFYVTGPWLADDFAKGGIWLFEPVPVSVVRGLGLGEGKGEGWWRWGGVWVRWWSGRGEETGWWRKGVMI